MDKVVLQAKTRDLSIKAKDLRIQKIIPAVCYGKGQDNLHVTMEYEVFRKVYRDAGSNTIIDLDLGEGKKIMVLVTDVQFHPVKGDIEHVDFHLVKKGEAVTTDIPLEYVGVAPAVKTHGGILNTNIDELTVRCLPSKLVHSIEVDLSSLAEIGDSLKLSDITIPEDIEVLIEDDITLCSIQAPAEEEPEEVAEVDAGDVPATAQKGEEESSEEDSE